MRRVLVLATLAATLAVAACGGGSDDSAPLVDADPGPAVMALPFLPTLAGETSTLGLANLSNTFAPVTLTAFTPAGVVYPPGTTTTVLAPRASTRIALASLTGAGATLGGWLRVDTRDVTTLDPVSGVPVPIASTGYVVPSLTRSTAGTETDAFGGIAPRDERVVVTINQQTQAIQLINMSYVPMAGGAVGTDVDFDFVIYDAFGDVFDTGSTTVPANGSFQVDFGILELGQVQVVPTPGAAQGAPAGSVFEFAIATQEDDPQVLIEARYLEAADPSAGQFDVGFDYEFGLDSDGNIRDLGVYIGNPTDDSITVHLTDVRLATGASVISSPRLVALDPHATKFMASTTLDSRGLDTGELSIFADIFGNVDLATGLSVGYLQFSIPQAANLSMRSVDSRFKSYRRIVAAYRQTTDVVVPVMPYELFTTTGIRNVITLMNPQIGAVTVNIRGFTPGGTEYVLPPVTVPAFSRVDWSPDGSIFREEPSSTTDPPVPFLSFLFSSSGGILFQGYRTRVNVQGLIQYQRPFVIRNLRTD